MSCPQFIADSMALRTAAHLTHLSTDSYAQHVALGDFYEALLPLVDRYAEVYMGTEGRIKAFPTPAASTGSFIARLEVYLTKIAAEMAEDGKNQALANILAELQALTAQTLYKLRNLK
jgi:hypothetical protein